MTTTDNKKTMRALLDSFLDFLFPINKSVYELQKTSPKELSEKLPKSPYINDWTSSLFTYADEKIKHLVWEIKYYRNKKITSSIGLLMAEAIINDLKKISLHPNDHVLVVPIPLTKRRLSERGFNHTELIAESILKNLPENFILANDVLQKIRHTPKQNSIENREDRFNNLFGVFAVADPHKVFNKNVLIIDDVTTTGATLLEARRALLSAGAKNIRAYTVAH